MSLLLHMYAVSGVSVTCNVLYCFIFKTDIICYILLSYHCSCDVTYILLMCWFYPFLLCVDVLSGSV
jgi:hypothetical protein